MKNNNRMDFKPLVFLPKNEGLEVEKLIKEIKEKSSKTVLAGEVWGSIVRNGLSNIDLIKSDFGVK